ncbi:MAG: hypothetical protein PSU94_04495 [Lacunisphaera sp.]|nr:hypothetical protein [Lacunisphaera sp.]
MNDLSAVALLLVNALVVAVAAWLLVAGTVGEWRSCLEPVLAWGLACMALVAGAGSLLGIVGWLGPGGFFALHAAILAGLGWLQRGRWPAAREALVNVFQGWREFFSRRDAAAILGAVNLLVWLGLAALAALAHPVVYDALTYRLSRIALWLQDGRIAHYATDDARLNYMPVVPDLMMAWLLDVFPEGYRLTGLAQAAGGALLLLATAGLGRLTGLGRAAALGAAALLFGMTNVATQFTSVHTDLFTAGVLAAAICLWLAALRRGQGSLWGGVGAGLALGSKGTVFYFAPGALLWVVVLAWWHPLPWAAWRRTLLAGLVAVAVFAGPGFWRNGRSYGGLLGPADMVELHHGGKISARGHLDKLRLNLATFTAQLFDPNAEPWWWQKAASAAQRALADRLPADDPYIFQNFSRREWMHTIAGLTSPDADVASCGLLLPLFFAAGLATALARRRDAADGLVLLWGGGLGLFVLCLNGMVQWHPYILRFLALGAPWLAVGAAWWMENLPRGLRRAAWALAALTTVAAFGPAVMRTYQSGWPAVVQPARGTSYFVYGQWRAWSAGLEPAGLPRTVALPINRPLAAFCRIEGGGPVRLAHEPARTSGTAEEFLQGQTGWVIVQADRFLGREGRVQGRTWLYFGQDGRSPYSLAAYRRLAPGEEPEAMLYRALRTVQPHGVTDDLLVRSWSGVARLRLRNASAAAWNFSVLAADDRSEGPLAAGETREVTLRIPAEQVAQVLVVLARPDPATAAAAPTVELRP